MQQNCCVLHFSTVQWTASTEDLPWAMLAIIAAAAAIFLIIVLLAICCCVRR